MAEASDKPVMSIAAQRVVVIEDASRGVSSSALKWALDGLALKPGDELTLVGILHQVNTPMGYKSRVDSNSMIGANKIIIYREVTRKMQEYENDKEFSQIFKLYETKKVKFSIEVIAGPSTKEVAIEAAMNLQATWVILDRKMKNDRGYFLEKLSCRISRMKRNNCLEEVRGPKAKGKFQVIYDEMIPGFPEEEELFSIALSPMKSLNPAIITLHEEQEDTCSGPALSYSSRSTSFSTFASSQENTKGLSPTEPEIDHMHCHEEKNKSKAHGKTMEDKSTYAVLDNPGVSQTDTDQKREDQQLAQNNITEDVMEGQQTEEMFDHLVCSICKNRKPKKGWIRDFSYAELLAATDGFSEKNFMSEGGLGPVFSGQLKDTVKIAVKQHREAKFQDEDEFKFEVHEFSKVRHKNVVKLLGSCSEGSHRFLVYEYACNGLLDQHLSENQPMPLTWMLRLKIALGASTGLNYLHRNNIIHRDIRSTNILLTHDHEALLGDFGLPRPPSESDQYSEHRIDWTFGYSAPEYVDSGKASTQTDVYSFGVLLLELITGRGTADKTFKGTTLVEWARPLLDERKYKELIDPRIVDSHDARQLSWIVRVTEKCLSKDPKKRSSMNSVVTSLKYIIEGKFEESSPVESKPESEKSAEKGGHNKEKKNGDKGLRRVQFYSIEGQMSRASSSSEAIATESKRLGKSTSSGKTCNGKTEKSQSRIQLHHGEMLV